MSPQQSNRTALVEGTLRCLERLPAEQVTARAIAAESGANLASIPYHFGSKEALVSEAVVLGLDRWLEEIAGVLAEVGAATPSGRIAAAMATIELTRERHLDLALNFLGALNRAQHDPQVGKVLIEGFRHTRRNVAEVLQLGDARTDEDTAGLIHALFTGLLFQTLLSDELAIEGSRMRRALKRLRSALAD